MPYAQVTGAGHKEAEMVKKSFFGIAKPKLEYLVMGIGDKGHVVDVPLPARAFLRMEGSFNSANELRLRLEEKVRTGQKLRLTSKSPNTLISPVTGTIKAISPEVGPAGEASTSIAIDVSNDEWDEEASEACKTSNLENVRTFLGRLPGQPAFGSMLDNLPSLRTFVINALERDLLVTTNQLVLKTEAENFKQGMEILKKITGVEEVILLVPSNLSSRVELNGVEVRTMDLFYPYSLPKLLMKKLFGKEVPAGGECEEMGVGFLNPEAIAALGSAFSGGRIPVEKFFTVIKKDGSVLHGKARIGTPVKDVFNALQVETHHGDNVVFGGPMIGRPAFSEDAPIMHETDAIVVQDKSRLVKSSDTHCVNCGECVRACPAKIPVNMLIRFLENNLWEDAVNQYDLLSCVECGLCSFVCTAHIPIFQYIMLGKHEFARMKTAEESHA